MKKTTIRDIARVAEVSVATVSLVLNKRDHKISQTTCEKVFQAAKTLNYQPPSLSLRLQKSGVIGLVIPSITNPYYPALARGVEDAAQKLGYSVLICTTYNNPQQEQQYIELLIHKNVDGIILTSVPNDETFKKINDNQFIKIVSFNRHKQLKEADFLTVDNVRGGYMAASHLLELGHRKIAYIGRHMARLKGFREAFSEKGYDHDPSLVLVNDEKEINVVIGEDVIDMGFSLTKRILKDNPDTTAIFAYNDLAAFGAMTAAAELGLKVPEDISIIGYDDIPFAAISHPPLTTIEQPKYERGKDAVEMLMKRINNERTEQVHIVYRPRLIIRNSTGPVRTS